MGRLVAVAIFLLFLTGCAKGQIIQVQPPNDPQMHVVGYQAVPIFTGTELTLGIPGAAFIPVVGPYLTEIIRFKAGTSNTLVLPILQEDMYETKARIDAARRRVSAYGSQWVQNPQPRN